MHPDVNGLYWKCVHHPLKPPMWQEIKKKGFLSNSRKHSHPKVGVCISYVSASQCNSPFIAPIWWPPNNNFVLAHSNLLFRNDWCFLVIVSPWRNASKCTYSSPKRTAFTPTISARKLLTCTVSALHAWDEGKHKDKCIHGSNGALAPSIGLYLYQNSLNQKF